MHNNSEEPLIIGYIDIFEGKEDLIRVTGWAVDLVSKSPCSVIFIKDKCKILKSFNIAPEKRPDVAKYLNVLDRSDFGFSFFFKAVPLKILKFGLQIIQGWLD